MRPSLVAFILLAGIGVSAAAPNQPLPSPGPDTSCTPDTRLPPTVGSGPSRDRRDLGDRLADSNGVICPPRNADKDIQITPPGSGDIKIIPPPPVPNTNTQPK
jgi:hypothetical protein